MICPLGKDCNVCAWNIPMFITDNMGKEMKEEKCVMQWIPLLQADLIMSVKELKPRVFTGGPR